MRCVRNVLRILRLSLGNKMIITPVIRLASLIVVIFGLCMAPYEMLPWLSELALHCIGVSGQIVDETHRRRFLDFYHTNGPGVIMYNHPTFYDYAVLAKEFGHRCRFVAFAHRLTFPTNWVAWKINTLNIKPSSGASKEITKAIESRERSTPMITMSPSGGYRHQDFDTHPNKLLEFRSGGFLARSPVLPIVIRYDPNDAWREDNIVHTVWQRLCGDPVHYRVHVLEPMSPGEEESVDDFKERVRAAMEAVPVPQKNEFQGQRCSYKGSGLLVFTSSLFFLPALLCFLYGLYVPGVGMILTAINSIRYHSQGCSHAKFIDIVSNFTLGAFFTISAWMSGNMTTVWMSLFAVCGNAISKMKEQAPNLWHGLLVHLPAFIGFMSIITHAYIKK